MRRALLIGINRYDSESLANLRGCVGDAKAMSSLLKRNEDGSPNYDCHLLTSSAGERVTRKVLKSHWHKLFNDYRGDILFYFSGLGTLGSGGVLVTQEGDPEDLGVSIDELVTLANRSSANSALLILDCCNTGNLGSPVNLQFSTNEQGQVNLREGLTILAAARLAEEAFSPFAHNTFTQLVLAALRGGAADIRGKVSAASIYAYVEQFLGSWDQRPVYRSHADHLPPVRFCRPVLPDALLRELPSLFSEPKSVFRLDPSYEFTSPKAKARKVAIFDKLKMFRNAGLVETLRGKDLYFTALNSGYLRLTLLGQLYWKMAIMGRL